MALKMRLIVCLLAILTTSLLPVLTSMPVQVWVTPYHVQRFLNGVYVGGTVYAAPLDPTIFSEAARDGEVQDNNPCDGNGNGVGTAATTMSVGDASDNACSRAFATFSLSGISGTLETAVMSIYLAWSWKDNVQDSTTPVTNPGLGILSVVHLGDYGTLDASDYQASSAGNDPGQLLSGTDTPNTGYVSISVLAAMQSDITGVLSFTSYRLQLATATDSDSKVDSWVFETADSSGTTLDPKIDYTIFLALSASASDSQSLTDTVSRLQSVGKPLTDQLNLVDTLTSLRNVPKSLSDVITLVDLLTSRYAGSVLLSDVINLSAILQANSPKYPNLQDTLTISESATLKYGWGVSLSDFYSVTDAVTRLRTVSVSLSEIFTLIDSLTRLGPPAVPGSFTAVKDTGNPVGSIDLSWTSDSNANPATVNYELQRSPDQSTWTAVCTCTTTSFVDTGLSPATGYYYRIRAYNGQNSAWSGIASAVTDGYLVSGGGGPTTGTYTLVVLIKDLLGTPLQGASVTQGSTSLLTDTSGIANFGTLTGGSYTLNVSASGCTDTSQSINLTSDHSASNPFIVNVQCGSQTATTGTAPNLPAIELFILPILGVALAGMAIAVYSNERSKKKRKRERQ